MISGTTKNSRLYELKKYVVTNNFMEQYVGNGSYNNNGVDYNNSVDDEYITYYIDGIKYVDDLTQNITTFYTSPSITSSPNFINTNYFKDFNKENIINNPKIHNDVFIDRYEQSVFIDNYRLRYVTNLFDLTTFVGGIYFNIINNT